LGGSDPPFVMSAHPGAVPALHTNPLAIGVPAHGHPFMLDMATSVVAEGKVHVAMERGQALAEGAVGSSDGRASGDPADFVSGGCLLPVGGHKGFGLSALIEVLTVGLSGADEPTRLPSEGALVVCISPASFRQTGGLLAFVESVRQRLRSSGSKDSIVMAPGDVEARNRISARGSIEISEQLLDSLRALAAARPFGER
jgi:LDH2 family malate/lactate/ureidoglycolate dehydrogenase